MLFQSYSIFQSSCRGCLPFHFWNSFAIIFFFFLLTRLTPRGQLMQEVTVLAMWFQRFLSISYAQCCNGYSPSALFNKRVQLHLFWFCNSFWLRSMFCFSCFGLFSKNCDGCSMIPLLNFRKLFHIFHRNSIS